MLSQSLVLIVGFGHFLFMNDLTLLHRGNCGPASSQLLFVSGDPWEPSRPSMFLHVFSSLSWNANLFAIRENTFAFLEWQVWATTNYGSNFLFATYIVLIQASWTLELFNEIKNVCGC